MFSLKMPCATFKKDDNNYYELNHFCREDNSNLCVTGQKGCGQEEKAGKLRLLKNGSKTAAKKWRENRC
jgi:hypothetical protein